MSGWPCKQYQVYFGENIALVDTDPTQNMEMDLPIVKAVGELSPDI